MKKALIATGMALLPAVAFAQTLQPFTSFFTQLLTLVNNTLIPLVFALALVGFFWGVVQYVIFKDEEAKDRGRKLMLYGIIGLVVMASVWGIVRLVQQTFGIENNGNSNITIPKIPN